ncbi:MAG: c-type cytochrome domain-containing protein, partial [bacterium]
MVWFVPQAAPAADPGIDFFEQKIRPLLVTRCEGCHSSVTGKTSGGLALDTRQGWANGGDNGPAIVPGKPEESLLLQAISYTDPDLQMPPPGKGERLTADEVAAVAAWIKAGAVDPRVAGER